ncbi:UNKNOWN [Stylonychia lemnae]|uniref:YTH domain-containing protein n=1 Tax=Stylonychia lemnae TaxID=5949 RepID=A0A078B6K8_STYLE|nr:UNKNOWN [Stylonychia lemnae]|eukprot:CDW89856.1 UNKNOWN [Stylonychia lemnae]
MIYQIDLIMCRKSYNRRDNFNIIEIFPKFLQSDNNDTWTEAIDVSSLTGDIAVGGRSNDPTFVTFPGQSFILIYPSSGYSFKWVKQILTNKQEFKKIQFNVDSTRIISLFLNPLTVVILDSSNGNLIASAKDQFNYFLGGYADFMSFSTIQVKVAATNSGDYVQKFSSMLAAIVKFDDKGVSWVSQNYNPIQGEFKIKHMSIPINDKQNLFGCGASQVAGDQLIMTYQYSYLDQDKSASCTDIKATTSQNAIIMGYDDIVKMVFILHLQFYAGTISSSRIYITDRNYENLQIYDGMIITNGQYYYSGKIQKLKGCLNSNVYQAGFLMFNTIDPASQKSCSDMPFTYTLLQNTGSYNVQQFLSLNIDKQTSDPYITILTTNSTLKGMYNISIIGTLPNGQQTQVTFMVILKVAVNDLIPSSIPNYEYIIGDSPQVIILPNFYVDPAQAIIYTLQNQDGSAYNTNSLQFSSMRLINLTIYTNSDSQEGVLKLQLYGRSAIDASYFTFTNFQIKILNRCVKAKLAPQYLQDMQYYIGKDILKQYFSAFTITPSTCGPITYQAAVLGYLIQPNYIYFSGTSRFIQVFTNDYSKVGDYQIQIQATNKYNNESASAFLTISIICQVFELIPDKKQPKQYQYYINQVPFLGFALNPFMQTPQCDKIEHIKQSSKVPDSHIQVYAGGYQPFKFDFQTQFFIKYIDPIRVYFDEKHIGYKDSDFIKVSGSYSLLINAQGKHVENHHIYIKAQYFEPEVRGKICSLRCGVPVDLRQDIYINVVLNYSNSDAVNDNRQHLAEIANNSLTNTGLSDQKGTDSIKLEAEIKYITNTGLVTIEFSKAIMIFGNFSEFGEKELLLKIPKRGSQQINFKWQIVYQKERTMKIQLDYEKPLLVSQNITKNIQRQILPGGIIYNLNLMSLSPNQSQIGTLLTSEQISYQQDSQIFEANDSQEIHRTLTTQLSNDLNEIPKDQTSIILPRENLDLPANFQSESSLSKKELANKIRYTEFNSAKSAPQQCKLTRHGKYSQTFATSLEICQGLILEVIDNLKVSEREYANSVKHHLQNVNEGGIYDDNSKDQLSNTAPMKEIIRKKVKFQETLDFEPIQKQVECMRQINAGEFMQTVKHQNNYQNQLKFSQSNKQQIVQKHNKTVENPQLKTLWLIKNNILNQTYEKYLKYDPQFAKFMLIRSMNQNMIFDSIISGCWLPKPKQFEIFQFVLEDAEQLRIKNNLGYHTPIYLIFSIKRSGMFQGIAQVMSPLQRDQKGSYYFKVKWLLVKNIEINRFVGIKYNQEDRDFLGSNIMTISHILGKMVLRLFIQFQTCHSLLNDRNFRQFLKRL